ncbi:MAG: hypothetical protein R2880_20830 [Deinococcales bacterium]
MSERIAIAALSLLSLLSLWLAPWAALSREVGAKSAVIRLPNHLIDFTGRIEALSIPQQSSVLWLSLLALLLLLAASFLKHLNQRYTLWLLGGLLLLGITFWGLNIFQQTVKDGRYQALSTMAQDAIQAARPNSDIPAIEAALANLRAKPIEQAAEDLRGAGIRIRRLPYSEAGMALASFLAVVTAIFALFFSLKLIKAFIPISERILRTIAVPATSILLAFLAAGVIILLLQPTPMNDNAVYSGDIDLIAGRLDTLFYAYQTLLVTSLGSVSGFLDALKFSTPLIFTGLAVALSFRAGLFNIGAPGQMILGAIVAMLVGVYLPGPKWFVLPLAVAAAALGGAFWGMIPGWLKARFGANEVINTILMNYIAASLMLFLLSSQHNFAAPAMRMLMLIGFSILALLTLYSSHGFIKQWRSQRVSFMTAFIALLSLFSLLIYLSNIIPWYLAILVLFVIVALALSPLLPTLSTKPRAMAAGVAILVLLGMVAVGLPREGDRVYSYTLPFKAEGSEPKSIPLSESARFIHLPEILARFNIEIPPTQLNASFLIAIAAAFFVYYFLWRTKWGYELRAVGLAAKAAEYGGANIARNTILAMSLSGALAGLTACHYVLGGALEDYALRQASYLPMTALMALLWRFWEPIPL